MRDDDLWIVRAPGRAHRAYEGDHQTASVVYQVLTGIDVNARLVRVPVVAQGRCTCFGCVAPCDPSAGYCWECEQCDCCDRDPVEQSAFHGMR